MEKEILNRKLKFLVEKFNDLKKYNLEFEKNKKEVIYIALQRIVEEIVETSIKINMILLREKNQFPKSYHNSFILMNEYLNFNEVEIEKIANFAKFINLLAHDYIEMSKKVFFENLNQIILLFPIYIKGIANLIEIK